MFRRTAIVVLSLVCGVLAGMVLTGRMRTSEEAGAQPQQQKAAPSQLPGFGATGAALPDFTRIAAQTVNAVTNISSMQVTRTRNSPFANDPFFRYFFGDADDMFGGRSRREASLGSGVVVSADGYVLTNNHVVGENVQEITVALADKQEMRAKIVGTDPYTDIALLKVDARGLPTIPWGDSAQLKVAEWVLAIGNPFQLNQTVTLGIISAVGRANVGIATYEDFIQTDAAINPGNSGGALINGRGQLVGINTAIYSQSGGYQGIGFAVPSNLARHVMNDLIKHGEVRRGSIGYVEVSAVTSQLAEDLGAPDTRGALVSRMARESAAYEAGVRPGDIIISFNGQRVNDPGQFLRLLADAPIGSTAKIGVIRDGRETQIAVPIASARTQMRRRAAY